MRRFGEAFEFQKKSKIKAGDGKQAGKYPFYTSSSELRKYTDDYLFDKESLIFGTGGNASVHCAQDKFSVSTDCLVAQPKTKDINVKFVYYYLFGNIRILEEGFKGAGLKHISKTYISDIAFPELSKAEQDKVVEALERSETLRQKRKEQLALLDNYLKFTFLEMFGDPVINEKEWEKKNLSKITHLITDGKHGDCRNEEGSGYYFISAKDIHDGIIDYSNARQITRDDFEEVHRRTNLVADDLVMVNTGATIGKTAIAPKDQKTRKTTFQKSVAIIKCKQDILLPIFLKYIFLLRLESFSGMSSGSAQQNLLLSQMREFKIILAPVELQKKFVQIVKESESIKKNMYMSLDEMDNHFNALTQKYFE